MLIVVRLCQLNQRSFSIDVSICPPLFAAIHAPWMGKRMGREMPKRVERLTDRVVRNAKIGFHADGGGLYLQVTSASARSWVYRYKLNGRVRDMGLGSYPEVGLADARSNADKWRRRRREGEDPIEAKKAEAAAKRLADARTVTFKDCAEQLIASQEVGWRNPKHRQQWRNTLATYAYPLFGHLAVADIDTNLVLKVLQQQVDVGEKKKLPLWNAKPETAGRLRGRIEAVLSSAKARGFRAGENPATWRGHLDTLLPPRSKVRRVVHHPALDYRDLLPFMARLRAHESISAKALEFTILCAARTGEVLGARFDEFDLEERVWVVPAERMKAGQEHRIPLSSRAVAIIEEMRAIRLSDWVFPGGKPGKPLSNMALLMLLRDLWPGVTVHGFRSTFKDWASEMTSFPDHLSEMALAHVSADKVRAAYARSDLFRKRRDLMGAWARYCEMKQYKRTDHHDLVLSDLEAR
jgi:integrase